MINPRKSNSRTNMDVSVGEGACSMSPLHSHNVGGKTFSVDDDREFN